MVRSLFPFCEYVNGTPIRVRIQTVGIQLIIIAAVLAVIVAGGGDSLRAESAQITLTETVNDVNVRRPESPRLLKADFSEAYVGQELRPGDLAMTHKDSELRVEITIREFTRVTRTTPNPV